ncbi:MAG: TatD family hydrolase [Endomicrobiaceae bacterium]|nr:TatD family hydrolase [Endomicrobiaceae bacterium]
MIIIDSHTHVWPDKVADKAKEYLEHSFSRPIPAVPTVSNLLKIMDENEILKSVIASVASRPDQVQSINNWLFSIRKDRFIPFASLHPFYDKWQEELDRIKDNAFGIKFQPEFQDFYIDDELIFPVYERIQKLNIPVLFHCGVELSLPGIIHAGPDKILKIITTFPELKFIGAHMGGFQIWDEVIEKLAGKNIYFDTSSALIYMKKEQRDRFIAKHSIDKILFGTDFPFGTQKNDIDFLNALDISETNKVKLFGGNIKKLLNI